MTVHSSGLLIVCRHTESEWDLLGKLAGKVDSPLSDQGILQAYEIGELLNAVEFNVIYTSDQTRSKQTMHAIVGANEFETPPRFIHSALSEQDYGDLTGMNIEKALREYGVHRQELLKQSWSVRAPGGESLQMVSDRMLAFFTIEILPRLKAGKNVLVVAHAGAVISLVKYLLDISTDAIDTVPSVGDRVFSFTFNSDGVVTDKEELPIKKSA